jgi:hypothetical protein
MYRLRHDGEEGHRHQPSAGGPGPSHRRPRGGVVISDEPLERFVPLYPAANSTQIITQYDGRRRGLRPAQRWTSSVSPRSPSWSGPPTRREKPRGSAST